MFIFAILLVLPALTLGQSQADFEVVLHEFFNRLDADGNGQLTVDEARAYFLAMDVNGDDKINHHEFETYMATIDPIFADHQLKIYDKFDINGDNHVERDDFVQSFRMHDANGDGELSYTEFATPIDAPPA